MSAQPATPEEGQFRRVVTARDTDGHSYVMIDSSARHFGTLHEHWAAEHVAAIVNGKVEDPTERPLRIAPPKHSSVFRFVEIEPEAKFASLSDSERRAVVRQGFERVNSSDALVDTARHPAMHRTETVDYIILLKGCLTMLLDQGEVELRPFDVVIQRGTNHAWVNRGATPALLAAVLINAG